ncbi:MAG: hypothetical protein GXP62_12330, partial [Oligoflexia bacterium]|nr:hypothetical protein [Oligoflexia bacterium]
MTAPLSPQTLETPKSAQALGDLLCRLPLAPTARAFAAWCGRQQLALTEEPEDLVATLAQALLVALGGAAVCRDLADGHVCVDLAALAG